MSERQLLAAAHRWMRLSGWRHQTWRGWGNADDTIVVRPAWDEGVLRVWRKSDGTWSYASRDYPVDSVREGVDLLCALRILPADLSSVYGAAADKFRGEVEQLEARVGELTSQLWAASKHRVVAEALEYLR